MNKKDSKITHIDLFAGPGGICTGFKSAGIKTVLAVEYIDTCCETYSANHPGVNVLCKDIRDVTDKQIRDNLKKMGLAGVDIVSGGFPCETFSTAGSKSRIYNDHRNYLYKEAIRIADAANAKILLLENVPAFISKRIEKGSDIRVLDLLLEDLKSRGFKYVDYDVLNAADYGVPQKRSRFILMASKKIPISKGMFNWGKISKRVTVNEAISDLPLIGPNSSSEKYSSKAKNKYQTVIRDPSFWGETSRQAQLTYHVSPKHRPGTLERLSMIRAGEGLKDLFDRLGNKKVKELQAKRVLPARWYIQRNQRLHGNGQSHTVTSHCSEEIVHPTLNRGPSLREAARLQSFPDHYDFKGGPFLAPHIYKTQDKYEQIGDAVPPLLARHLGISIVKILESVK